MRWGELIVSATVAAILAVASSSGGVEADEDEVLWISRPEKRFTLIAQLHRGGYAWVRLGKLPGGGMDPVMNLAFRVEPRKYEELQRSFHAAGLKEGMTAECSEGFRAGIYPVYRLSGPGTFCAGTSGLLDEMERALLPNPELVVTSWQKLLDITRAEGFSRAMKQRANLHVTLKSEPGKALTEGPGDRDGLVSDELVHALKGPWGVEPVLVDYAVAFDAGNSSRASFTFPRNARLFVNGVDVAQSPVFDLVERPGAQVTAAGVVGWWRYRFDRGAGNTARSWIAGGWSFWFPKELWADHPNIELASQRGDDFSAWLVSGPADDTARLCTSDKRCAELALEDARGLAAIAFGECKAALPARRASRSRRSGPAASLFVRISQHTCSLRFDGYCLNERRSGLDRVLQMLMARSVEANVFGPDATYPLCETSPR